MAAPVPPVAGVAGMGGAGHGAMSVDRLAANASCPFTSCSSYQLGTIATSGRLCPGLSVPRAALLAAGEARKVIGLVMSADVTTQSAADADVAAKAIATRNATAYPETATDRHVSRAL